MSEFDYGPRPEGNTKTSYKPGDKVRLNALGKYHLFPHSKKDLSGIVLATAEEGHQIAIKFEDGRIRRLEHQLIEDDIKQ